MSENDKREHILMKAIKNELKKCHYKEVVAGIDICRLHVFPCEKIIDDGKCDVLIDIFNDPTKLDLNAQ